MKKIILENLLIKKILDNSVRIVKQQYMLTTKSRPSQKKTAIIHPESATITK
ncbi:hypothetical protein NEAUS04_1698 [Nematocida ausubeli]|nr:hypothetical protein NEAUS04_1698 [Nematocida ausubeli]